MTTLIVDGYNIIHAWPALRAALDRGPLEEPRRLLVQRLAEYAAVRSVRVIVVFDGPRRAGPASPAEVVDAVEVHFSGRSGSADHLIERLAYQATRADGADAVQVATSDRLQRDMVRAMGCQTIDARTLEAEVTATLAETQQGATRLQDQARSQHRIENQLPSDVLEHLERLRRGEDPEAGG